MRLQSSSASHMKMCWHFVHIVGRLRYGRGWRMEALYEKARRPRAMGTGQALCAAIGCFEDGTQYACSIKESGPILQSLGWTKGLPLRALAFTKRTVSACCLRLQRKAVERSQESSSTWLSTASCTHSPCTATVGDPLGSARVGDPFGATKYENVEGCQATDSPMSSQLHLQSDHCNVGPRLALAGQRQNAATACEASARIRNRNEAKSFFTAKHL